MYVRIRPSARLREGYCSRPVSLSVCLSVPALAASASVETSNQRYPLVSLRLFLDFEDFRHVLVWLLLMMKLLSRTKHSSSPSKELLILTEGLLWIHLPGKYLLRIMMVLVNGRM